MNRIPFYQIVRALSWIGDFLLIGGAVGLLIAKGDQLTPGFAAVLGLFVFFGSLLPIMVFYVEYLQRRQATQAAEARAPDTFLEALAQLNQLVDRVETAARDAAKTTLAARQLPGLMQETQAGLQSSIKELQSLRKGLEALPGADALAALSHPEAPIVDLGPIEKAIAALQPASAPEVDLSAIEKALADLAQAKPATVDLAPLETTLSSLRRDLESALLVREDKLESIIEQLQSIEDMIADGPTIEDAEADTKKDEEPEGAPDPAPAATVAKKPKPEAEPEPAPEEAPEPKPAPVKKVAKKKRAAKKITPLPPTAEGDLFGAQPAAGLPADHARLLVKALVGVNNRVYVRGDPPLQWDHGRPLEATGIGEWRLDLEGIDGPVEIEMRVNDEIAAKGAPVVITPGQILKAAPQFPPANEPF